MSASYIPELEAYYYEQCEKEGKPGYFVRGEGKTEMLHVAEDPDKAWAELGQYFLHEATTYAQWQTPDVKSAVHSHAKTPDELRAEGIYEIITPEECATRGPDAQYTLHPLVGGMPLDEGWKSLTLFVEQVIPKL